MICLLLVEHHILLYQFRTSEKTQLNTQVKEFRDAKKQLSHKLIKESEKVVAIQAEKQTLDGELQNSKELVVCVASLNNCHYMNLCYSPSQLLTALYGSS